MSVPTGPPIEPIAAPASPPETPPAASPTYVAAVGSSSRTGLAVTSRSSGSVVRGTSLPMTVGSSPTFLRSFSSMVRPPANVSSRIEPHKSKIGTDLNLTSLFHGIDSVAMSDDIRIGTQGWNYDAWVGPFYPPGTRPADFLSVYSRAFTTVEVDSTFYAIPAAKTMRAWAERTPPSFSFALKLPQEITHENRLRDSADVAALFFDRARELGPKLGPILMQLSPDFAPTELPALASFLPMIPRDVRVAVEFRQ